MISESLLPQKKKKTCIIIVNVFINIFVVVNVGNSWPLILGAYDT